MQATWSAIATVNDPVSVADDDTSCPVCRSTLSRPKLLSCLHAVCHGCVAHCTRHDGDVVCPHQGCLRVTDGLLARSALHDHHPLRRLILSRSADTTRRCEECLEDDAGEATATCEDCAMLLCDYHADAHKRSRSTAKHRLKEGKEAVSRPPTTSKCSFHPANDLNKFCSDCKRVLCEHCAGLASHAGHTVTSATSAVKDQGTDVKRRAKRFEKTVAPELKRRLSAVQTSKEKVNARVEEMSATVTGSVQKVIDMIKEEEGKLLEDIDQARWAELIELEKTEIALKDLIAVSERAVGLTSASSTQSLTDAEFLQVVTSALPSLDEAGAEAEKPFEQKEWQAKITGNEEFEQSYLRLLETGSVARCTADGSILSFCPAKADRIFEVTIVAAVASPDDISWEVVTPSGKLKKLDRVSYSSEDGTVKWMESASLQRKENTSWRPPLNHPSAWWRQLRRRWSFVSLSAQCLIKFHFEVSVFRCQFYLKFCQITGAC